MRRVEEALAKAGVTYTYTGWAPLRPPAPPYAVLVDEIETLGADGLVMAYEHSMSIELYTEGKGEETRRKLALELAFYGIHFQQMQPIYLYEQKMYETVFELEDFYEKVSEEYGDINEAYY